MTRINLQTKNLVGKEVALWWALYMGGSLDCQWFQ
jgi:hypothetical protein